MDGGRHGGVSEQYRRKKPRHYVQVKFGKKPFSTTRRRKRGEAAAVSGATPGRRRQPSASGVESATEWSLLLG